MQILGMILTVDILPWLGGTVDAIMGLPRRIEKCYHRFDSLFERLLDEHLDPARPKLEREDIVDVMLKILKDEKTHFNSTKEHIKAVLLVSHGSCFPLFFLKECYNQLKFRIRATLNVF